MSGVFLILLSAKYWPQLAGYIIGLIGNLSHKELASGEIGVVGNRRNIKSGPVFSRRIPSTSCHSVLMSAPGRRLAAKHLFVLPLIYLLFCDYLSDWVAYTLNGLLAVNVSVVYTFSYHLNAFTSSRRVSLASV